jgi:DNA mismatch repair ATPase MutL
MPIAELPDTTARALGSNQALTDSVSVLKELVDNSIDARATAIFIEISINGLDILRVSDNGHGIAPADRHLIGRRYCTSKITTFDDLNNIGGSSLGFLGEALASACDMSSGVAITTRVESEVVATVIQLDRQGKITRYSKEPRSK